jgi:threonine aldolase
MALTMWTNVTTGRRLNEFELTAARQQARIVYEKNSHIFEDERDALGAMGVVPVLQAQFERSAARRLALTAA